MTPRDAAGGAVTTWVCVVLLLLQRCQLGCWGHGGRHVCVVLVQSKACMDLQKLLEASFSLEAVSLVTLLLLLLVVFPAGHHLLGARQAAAAEQCSSVCHGASSNKGRSGGAVRARQGLHPHQPTGPGEVSDTAQGHCLQEGGGRLMQLKGFLCSGG